MQNPAYTSPPMSGTLSRTTHEESTMNANDLPVTTLTASDARARLFTLLEEVNQDDDLAVHITSKHGTGVLIGERHWRSLMETIYLFTDPVNSIPLQESILGYMNGEPGVEIDPKTLKPIE
jgi:antitoxin YefM